MTKILNSKQFKNTIITSTIGLLLFPTITFAAILYFEPASGEYHQDETFVVDLRLDTEGEEINVVEADIKLPSDFLDFVDFSKGGSILGLFAKEPTLFGDTFSFIGGVPGGFKGEGRIGRIIVKGKKAGEGSIDFGEDFEVLLNDGLGTRVKLSTQKADFTILAERLEIPKDAWQEELKKDKIPPESFKIEIGKEAAVFEGKYFISFSTVDGQSGIAYYEVKEGKRAWKPATSPYLLEEQSLKDKILVKALDNAGNERIAEILPPKKPFPYWLAVILILIGMGVIWWIIRRKKIESRK